MGAVGDHELLTLVIEGTGLVILFGLVWKISVALAKVIEHLSHIDERLQAGEKRFDRIDERLPPATSSEAELASVLRDLPDRIGEAIRS